jgi:hypothetical protein
MESDGSVNQLSLFGEGELTDEVDIVANQSMFPTRIVDQSKVKLELIAKALASGVSWAKIADSLHCSRRTINRVRQLHPELIEQGRQELAGKFFALASMSVDDLMDKVMAGKVQPNVLAMVAGVAVDKAQVLSGRASNITESRVEKSDDIDRLRADLSLLQKGDMSPILDAEVVEKPGSTRSGV